MAFVGYARVSSVGQSLDVQLDKLKHCDKIYKEKKSGTSNKRPKLEACLEYVREEDTGVCVATVQKLTLRLKAFLCRSFKSKFRDRYYCIN